MRSNLLVALTIVFLDTLGVGLIVPVIPSLFMSLGAADLQQAALWGGIALMAYGAAQFSFAPVIGRLSDRFGRKPIFIGCLLGLALDYSIMAVTQQVLLIFVGRVVGGLFGATYVVANSSVSDEADGEKRASEFGLIGAAAALGLILGPMVGGLLGTIGPRAPFVGAAALSLACAGFAFVMFRETRVAGRTAGSVQKETWSTVGFPDVRTLLSLNFLVQFALQSQIACWTFFTIARFGWTSSAIGVSIAAYGMLLALAQALLAPALGKGIGNRKAIVLGSAIAAVGFLLVGVADDYLALFTGMVLSAAVGIVMPLVKVSLSDAVDQDRQGLVQGLGASADSAAAVVGPIVMSAAFYGSLQYIGGYGVPFLIACAILVFTTVMAMAFLRRSA